MKYISIQLQPALDSSVDKNEVINLLRNAGYPPEVDEGYDDGEYINFHIQTNNLKNTWKNVLSQLNKLPYFSSSSIVTCEGKNGWDDYLLLYHFDKGEGIDEL